MDVSSSRVEAMVAVDIPEEVYRVIDAVARKRGRSVEELLVESILPDLNPRTRVEVYLKLHGKYLEGAEGLYGEGDLVQAGEKYWGAVAALLKAIAETRGRAHLSHRDLRELASELYKETGDRDVAIGYKAAESLHANYYESFMTPEDFELTRELVLKLVEKLRRLIPSQFSKPAS